MARPRDVMAARTASGKKIYKRGEDGKEDEREVVAQQRVKHLGAKVNESRSPLGGSLAGLMFLRRAITLEQLGRFYSFLQYMPRVKIRNALRVRISGAKGGGGKSGEVNEDYWKLVGELGGEIEILHALSHDRLICRIDKLRRILRKVPLNRGGIGYMNLCERYHPEISGDDLGRLMLRRRKR